MVIKGDTRSLDNGSHGGSQYLWLNYCDNFVPLVTILGDRGGFKRDYR